MKIRTQLLVLTLGSLGMMVLAFLTYLMILAPLEDLRRENTAFVEASRRAETVRAELNGLAGANLIERKAALETAVADYNQTVDAVGGLTLLPALNETMAEAVRAVVELRDLSMESVTMALSGVDDLVADAQVLGWRTEELAVPVLAVKADHVDTANQADAPVSYHLTRLVANIQAANDALVLAGRTINEKDAIVSGELVRISLESLRTAALIVLAVLVLVLGVSLPVSAGLARSLRTLSTKVGIMRTGDFTGSFSVHRRDELGDLGRDLNHLLESLNQSLGGIQQVSKMNAELREELIRRVEETGASAVEIEANSESIRAQMVRMDGMAEAASGQIGGIVSTVEVFHHRLRIQDSHVAETAAAVTQMASSVQSIAAAAERDRGAADRLVREAQTGKAVFDDSFAKVAEVSEAMAAIQEMASLIADLANQTSILALNAAIEAAHAGDFGRGFSVVADEIGKLATESARSSGEIARTITGTVGKIAEAAATKEATTEAFSAISQQIHEVSQSIEVIYGAVGTLQSGAGQVQDVLEILTATSLQLTEESTGIGERTKTLDTTMEQLGRISQEVTSNIGEIGAGVRLITQSVHSISDLTEQLEQTGGQLDTAIGAFQTGQPPP